MAHLTLYFLTQLSKRGPGAGLLLFFLHSFDQKGKPYFEVIFLTEHESSLFSPASDPAAEEDKNDGNTQDSIRESGSITVKNPGGVIHCLTIVGQIEGHQILPPQNKTTKYEHVMPQLAAIEESPDIDGLLILLNTVGGDVEAGLAIAELISSMKKPTVSLVLGGGHSIGVPLAVASKRSFIVPTASMTIHPVRLSGVVIGVPQTYAYFEKIQERIVHFVTANSKISEKKFKSLMLKTGQMASDVGTVIYGGEAVRLGLIDCLGGLSDALSCLHEMIREDRERAGGEDADAPAPEEATD